MNRTLILILSGLGLWLWARETQANVRLTVEAPVMPDDPSIFEQAGTMVRNNGGEWRLSQRGLDLIKRFEGWRASVYDANPPNGDWTIGYGHKIKPNETFPAEITPAMGEDLLRQDVATAEDRVNSMITVPMNQNMFDALTSLAYNLTWASWVKAATRINRGESAESVFPLYVFGGGVKMAGLVNRRAAELALFLS
jgi:lysozyme